MAYTHKHVNGVDIRLTAAEIAELEAHEIVTTAAAVEAERIAAIKAEITDIEDYQPRSVRELGVRLGDQESLNKDALIEIERAKL